MTWNFLKVGEERKATKGFSMIELSVVMTVAAAATVGFLSWTQPPIGTNAAKAVATTVKMQDIQKAIESFRVKKKRLPCPADPLMRGDNTRASVGTDYNTPTGTSLDYYVNPFGIEDIDITQTIVNGTTTYGQDCAVSVGAVPAFSLGLDETYVNDAWGRRFTYHVAPSLCGTDAGTGSGISQEESRNAGCSDKDYKTKTGNLTVTNGSSDITAFAAYVIVSHGANGAGAFLPSGSKLAASSNSNEIENGNGSNSNNRTYVKADQSQIFDDIVVFATKNQVESIVNRKSIKHISVADCEANSQALKNITLTENTAMQSLTTYQQSFALQTQNTGDQALLSIMKATQSICVSYYGATAATINTQTWSGAQCPGNNNPTANGSTYTISTDSCSCASGLWDGNCVPVALPNDFTGMKLWLDANDQSTLFTNIDCATGGNPISGASIACWKDKSGLSNHATAGTAPAYIINVFNGKPIIRFNGSSTYLTIGTALLNSINTGNTTVFIVAKTSVVQNSSVIISYTNAGNPTYNVHLPWGDSKVVWDFGSQAGTGRINVLWGGSVSSRYIWTFNASGNNNQNVWRNGDLVFGKVTSETPSFGTTYNLDVGSGPNRGSFYNGDIAEIIIYNTALSVTDRQAVRAYLNAKWAVY